MSHDAFEGGSRLAAGLKWVAATVMVVALHVAAITALVQRAEPASTATGGPLAIDVDLDPVEGEKTPDEMQPAEASGDPATAAAAAAAAAANMPAPMPAPVAPPPPNPAPPPEPPKLDPLPPPELEPLPPPSPEPPKVLAPPEAPSPLRSPSRSSAASAASAASEETARAVERLSTGREAAWRGQLAAHLNRFRRFPPGVGSGTARIGFTIDGEGRVTAVAVVSASGSATLDAAAARLVERASPFPPPPAGVSGKSLSFVVPVHFDGRRQP